MRVLRRLVVRISRFLGRDRLDQRLAEEFETHLAMQTDDNVRAGMSPGEARRQALLAAGGLQPAAEAVRDARRLPVVETTVQDLRYAVRMLRKSPGFAIVVTAILAAGIGANTAIYSLTEAVLTPVGVVDPSRVVFVWTEFPARGFHQAPASIPDFREWEASGVFSSLGGILDAGFNVRIGATTERVKGLLISGHGFEVLGVPAAIGRTIQPGDAQPGQANVVVLTDALWRKRFGADPAVVGRDLVVNGIPHHVIGVLPATFPEFSHEEMYAPLVFAEPAASDRTTRNMTVLGRLAPSTTLAAAGRRIGDIMERLGREFPGSNGATLVRLQPIGDAFVENARVILVVLFGAVGLLLLIACANIASLLLARGASRARELALRTALGASRWRLTRQLLVEHLLLGAIGGAAGLLPAIAAMRFIASFQVDELPNVDLVKLNTHVLLFDVALSVAVSVLFGLVPVWQAWHTDIRHGLRTAVAAASGAVQHRLRSAFVVVELSLAIVLLVAAGLLVRSFQEIRSADPGYDPNGALAMRLALSDDRYPTPASMRAFYERLHDEARQLPGVAGVSAANELPTTDDYHAASLWTSDDPSMRSEDRPVVLYESVMPDYFEVMGTPLLEGRAFAPADSEHAPLVAIVDRSTALKNWPGESPIGRRLKVGRGQPWREVVGVVADMEQGVLVKLLKGRLGQVYLPFAQEPKAAMSLVVRANVVPATLVPALRDLVRKADVDQPLFQVETMVDARAAGRAAHRLATTLVAAFAAAALLLATLGIYGVVANGVGERTREFGIRLSLGARPSDVLGLVLRHAIALMGIGTIVGLLAAAALTRAVSTLLVGVRTTDPATFGGVVLLLAAVGVLASYVPARRATRVDPATTLRCE